jgi:hypothetical protein
MSTDNLIEDLRVTQILSPFSGYSYVQKHILEEAAARGTRIHDSIKDYLTIGKPLIAENPQEQGYLESFKTFWKPFYSPVVVEKRYNQDGYTGQCDCLIQFKNRHILLDWKTSKSVNRTWEYQTAAYRDMCQNEEKIFIDECWVIQLLPDGTNFECHIFVNSKEAFQTFLKCKDLYEIFFKGKTNQFYE